VGGHYLCGSRAAVVAVVSAAFTPGPWFVFERDTPKRLTDQQAGSFIHCGANVRDDTGFDLIARAYTRDGMNERQANARLIAAAPELYEALDNLVANVTEAFPALADLGPITKAHAALAKARGEAL
jgi:hypothetical protein